MNYYINPGSFSAIFTIPTAVTDRYLKLAKGEHIKVILYILRNMSKEVSEKEISEQTGVSEYDVTEALLYWADAGILLPKEAQISKSNLVSSNEATIKNLKPQRNDIAKRGLEDPKIMYLLRESQMKIGRNLKSNESSTLVWLYEDQGLDISLILLIIQYAISKNRCNIRFIESLALDWVSKGINTISLADKELAKTAQTEQAWNILQTAFGIEKRLPSKKEKELSYKWIVEWDLNKDLLKAAYDSCVDVKSKFSMPYVAKILENWHNKGYKKAEDIEYISKSTDSNNFAAYDLDAFEEMLNSKNK